MGLKVKKKRLKEYQKFGACVFARRPKSVKFNSRIRKVEENIVIRQSDRPRIGIEGTPGIKKSSRDVYPSKDRGEVRVCGGEKENLMCGLFFPNV